MGLCNFLFFFQSFFLFARADGVASLETVSPVLDITDFTSGMLFFSIPLSLPVFLSVSISHSLTHYFPPLTEIASTSPGVELLSGQRQSRCPSAALRFQ